MLASSLIYYDENINREIITLIYIYKIVCIYILIYKCAKC